MSCNDQEFTVFIGNTNTLELSGLHDEIANVYINNATVTASLYDVSGTAIAGQSWPLTLTYVAASNGVYRGQLSHSIVLKHNQVIKATLTANSSGLVYNRTISAVAKTR